MYQEEIPGGIKNYVVVTYKFKNSFYSSSNNY